jgi:hypothetical protein
MTDKNGQSVTWQWATGILMLALFGVIGYLFSRVDTALTAVQSDVTDIKQSVAVIVERNNQVKYKADSNSDRIKNLEQKHSK